MKGELGYEAGASKPNLLYDPQTPTAYLQEQLAATEPGSPDYAFLEKAIEQRGRLHDALHGLRGE
jgi:hypothetical protein